MGAPMDLYRDPENRFVVGFIGSPAMNVLERDIADGHVTNLAQSQPPLVSAAVPSGLCKVTLGMRSEHIQIDRAANICTVDLA